jgi:hypothetical protein
MQNRWRERLVLPKFILASILVIVALFGLHQEAIAGVTGKIIGIVTDATTGEALPAANILITGTEMGAAADETGYYLILKITPGVYQLEARVMGYTSVTKTDIEIIADHTTPVNFELEPTVIAGEGITITAAREVIKMDLSASSISAKSDDIAAVPFVNDIGDFINEQVGVTDWMIRGGSIDEGSFMADGLMLVDNRMNEPILLPNLSMIQELNIIKGGFNAEYDNVRSGLINIITKDPPREGYHGNARFEFSPAHLKHRGPSRFDPENWFVKPFVSEEDSLCWYGTGILPDSIRGLYRDFAGGWFAIVSSDTIIEPWERKYAEALRDKFIWQHCLEGADELVSKYWPDYDGPERVREYGNIPDLNVDVGFGGPIIGDKLGFYASYRQNREAWALPVGGYRDHYEEENIFLKITARPTKDIKVKLEGMYGEQNTLSQVVNGDAFASGLEDVNRHYGESSYGGLYLWDGMSAFNSNVGFATDHAYTLTGLSPYNIYHNMIGFTLDHALSSNTFYTVRLTYIRSESECRALDLLPERDPTSVVFFDTTIIIGTDTNRYTVSVTEEPWGWYIPVQQTVGDAVFIGGRISGTYDTSSVHTWNLKVDLTSQINQYNEIKLGFLYNRDNINNYYEKNRWESPHENWIVDYDANPIRGGAYVQDKIEYAGIIANLGVRVDFFDPNTDWFELGTYSQFFTQAGKAYLDDAPKECAEGHLVVSPRLGISHPISENAKLYFNYGDFYSMPRTRDLYQIWYGRRSGPLGFIGDPELKFCRTTAYELGAEISIADMYGLHIAGYYRDVKDEPQTVYYTGYDGLVSYGTAENNRYQDVRGFEIRLSKDFGKWFRGYVNYDYRVTSDGRIGRDNNYESLVRQYTEGMADPFQEKPLARPIISANAQFFTPSDFGPALGDISLSVRFDWEAGWYETWDPLREGLREEKYMNQQWAPWKNVQLKLQKGIEIVGTKILVYAQVNNLFDWKYLNSGGFEDDEDERAYKRSLHLPLYNEEPYASNPTYTGGSDHFGDMDKPYIDMPNIEDLTFRNPRSFLFGIGIDF